MQQCTYCTCGGNAPGWLREKIHAVVDDALRAALFLILSPQLLTIVCPAAWGLQVEAGLARCCCHQQTVAPA
eukprot:scaffold290469_cov15-Tisochrysis_lutea.AAC.1